MGKNPGKSHTAPCPDDASRTPAHLCPALDIRQKFSQTQKEIGRVTDDDQPPGAGQYPHLFPAMGMVRSDQDWAARTGGLERIMPPDRHQAPPDKRQPSATVGRPKKSETVQEENATG